MMVYLIESIWKSKALKLGYFDKSGNPVQGAYVAVDSILPLSGLSHTPIESVAGEEGNYTLTLTPYVPTVFTVRFYANGSNSQPASSVFVLVVNDVSTNLEIFASPSVEIGLTDTYNVTFRYELFNGTGVENAAISVVYSGPSGKLRFNTSQSSLGNYSIEFAADLPATYVITIIAFKPFHQRASDSFSLIISNIPTELTMSVGSSANMGLTDTFELTIRYQMLNGTGIEGASINVVHSGAPSTLNHLITPLGFGNYSIQITATLSSNYLVTIAASKQYCQASSSSFLLSVAGINTTLASLNGTVAFVGFGKDYRLFVRYTNASGYGLVGANVSVVDADPGITWNTTRAEGLGVYSILFTPLVSNTLSVVVQATLANHQTKAIFFTLTVTAIRTTLLTLNSSTSIPFDSNFTVYMHFQDEDSNDLENASLGFLTLPANLTYSPFEELGNGIYRVTLSPLFVDTYDVVFSASKAGYQTDYAGFVLTATIIQTGLRIAGDLLSDSITYSEQIELLVFYTRSGAMPTYNITEATIRVETSTSGLQWSWSEDLSGGYHVIIDPQRTGNWTLYIHGERDGYEESSSQFRLEVNPLTILIEVVPPLRAFEDSTFNVIVKLTESGTNNPIDGAYVTYRLSPARQGAFNVMNATGNPGEYSFTYTVPLLFGAAIYRLEINAEKENYRLPIVIDESFIIDADPIKDNLAIIQGTSGIGTFLVVFFVALRIYSGRKKKQLSHDLAIKQRFDDADNIIGVIILHKKSGLPIYSKMMKGGFEEGIVAAFITAVTHFREEFEMFDEEAMTVVPISDIIRAVQTRNLICAIITVRSASIEHNRKMEEFARQVATYLDDLVGERPNGSIDSKVIDMLEYIFNRTMDGFLLQYYKVATAEKFPKRYEILDETLHDTDTRHCTKPVLLAKSLVSYGVTEARGCTLVLEAIEKELIILCEEEETETTEIDFAEFFSKPDRVGSEET